MIFGHSDIEDEHDMEDVEQRLVHGEKERAQRWTSLCAHAGKFPIAKTQATAVPRSQYPSLAPTNELKSKDDGDK